MFVLGPNEKGAIAEAEIAAAAIRLGVPVLRPVAEHCRYDLAFDLGHRMLRVQCKWGRRTGDVIAVPLTSTYYTRTRQVRAAYTAAEIDAIAAYCDNPEQCYLIPIERVAGCTGIHLRLAKPGNGQRAGVNLGCRLRVSWGYSSAGRAPPWHGGGRRFESD